MTNKLGFLQDESGVSTLATASVLMAFVVAGSIFASTVVSTGNDLTSNAKDAIYAGVAQIRGSLELKGSVLLMASGGTTKLVFTASNVPGGQPVDLTDTFPDQLTRPS